MVPRWSENTLTVTEFTQKLQRDLEPRYRRVEVKGEVSSARAIAAGHVYFTLRDEGAQLPCVIWRMTLSRLATRITDGQKVVVTGELTLYPPQGRYQLVVNRIVDVGLGDELMKLEELKRRLHAEGLFDPTKKRPLPAFPSRIGLVTALTGAALHDFVVTARRRFPCDIVLCACRVQGELAPRSIVGALRVVSRWPGVELVVLTRGGGSAIDLLAFSDERVVRQIASSPVPVVSAVGHEIDVTLSDFVADVRAMTPTAAAERVLPSRAELGRRLDTLRQTLLHHIERRLGDARQRLEYTTERGAEHAQRRLDQAHRRLSAVRDRLGRSHPKERLFAMRTRQVAVATRLDRVRERLLSRVGDRLALANERLRLLSPQASLDRGWALVRREGDHLVRGLADAAPGDRISIALSDGVILATVDSLAPRPPVGNTDPRTTDEDHL